jgi:hypothetical protein
MASSQINQIIGQNEQGSLIVRLENPWFVLTLGFQKKCCIMFTIQLPFCFVIKGVKLLIYHNCKRLFYKSNFNIYIFSYLVQMKQWKFILELFSKVYTYIVKNTQISKPFKGKHIWISLSNNNSQNNSSWKNMIW